jgi:hypothetical protein
VAAGVKPGIVPGVELICRVLRPAVQGFLTSRGYRAGSGRAPSVRQLRDELLVPEIARFHAENYAVVLKPAPTTPLSVRFLIEAAAEASIPAGVINLVTGGAETGDALVRHLGVGKVAFTV